MDLLWQQAAKTLYLTREQFEASLLGWSIEEVHVEGALAGAILRKGPELHFASFGTGHVATRKIVLDAVRGQLEQFGHVVTKTPKEDERQGRFNRLVGFKVVGSDKFDTHYRLDAGDFRYKERLSCPSQQ